ncbi:MAG TPA: uroporphyrinogen-III C-methyltransferase [Opitutaceae bacterium]|nr:uroporphyrinogen-III C-methyltransferase [Opitutaceae bacterium]
MPSSAQNPGLVSFVGTGPGEPDLATLRAREVIAAAEVLVYDDAVPAAVVAWSRPACERIRLETGGARPPRPPEEVAALLEARAREGRRVVRLKTGDPYVFGRAGTEVRRLAAAGVPFEVVPGVTAALAAGAYAGVPLVQCGAGNTLILLPGNAEPPVDWRRYGALPNPTLAIYMAGENLPGILAELVAGGLAPATPAVAVQSASLGRQRTVAGTAATLGGLVAAAKLDAATVVLVGEAVRDHGAANWFEQLPLFGRRVAVTRSREQAGELRRRLEALGAEVVELPLIEIRPVADREETVDILAGLGSYDWIVFTSANGVRHFFDLLFRGFRDVRALGAMRIACVGEATARAVRDLHLEVEICPATATAEALADAMIATGGLDNVMVLVVTGNLNRDLLVKKLEGARAIVDRLQVYENVRADLAGNPGAEDFRRRGADAILFASTSAVHAFAQQKSLQPAPGARRPLTGSLGPLTSQALREEKLPVDFEATAATPDALVAALVAKLASG